MTMDNGEGRPLDESEAEASDPQGWYFDLPGGAWERQEQKNRELRQRVAGNLEADREARKNDPWILQKPEPQPNDQQKRGGLFRLRKNKDSGPSEAAAARAGSERGEFEGNFGARAQERPEETFAPSAEDYSTEAVLFDPPGQHREAAPPGPTSAVADSFDNEDDGGSIVDAMRASSHAKAEPVAAAETSGDVEDTDVFHGGFRPESRPPLSLRPAEDDVDEGAFAWGATPDTEAAADTDDPWGGPEAESSIPSGPVDTMAWDDQAAGNDEGIEPEFAAREAVAGAGESEAPAATVGQSADGTEDSAGIDNPDDDDAIFGSMQKWVEQSRSQQHGGFELRQSDEPTATPAAPPVPLRPRRHDELEEGAGGDLDAPAARVDSEATRAMPIVLHRNEPAAPAGDPDGPPTRWDEFFGLGQPDEAEGSGDEPLPEGLAAMREWAHKRQEPAPFPDVPEEFLKPFDWELEEDDPSAAATPVAPAPELLQPFDWETVGETDDLQGESEPPGVPALEHPVDGGVFGEFPAANAVPQREASLGADSAAGEQKKRGRFGRLFGRKDAPEGQGQLALPPDELAGDWVPTDEPGQKVATPGDNDEFVLPDAAALAEVSGDEPVGTAGPTTVETAEWGHIRGDDIEDAGFGLDEDGGAWLPIDEEPAEAGRAAALGLPDGTTRDDERRGHRA